MIKSKMNNIISSLEIEIDIIKNELDSFDPDKLICEEEYLNYSKLMGKKMFLNDCINNIKCSFVPGGDCYEQDKSDFGVGFKSYYEGQLESFDLYLSIIKSVS